MMAGKTKIPCHVGNRMKAQDLWSKERFTFTPRKKYAMRILSSYHPTRYALQIHPADLDQTMTHPIHRCLRLL